MNAIVKNPYQRFVADELGILAWGASVQRANLYNSGIPREQRDVGLFREDLMAYVERELLPVYTFDVSESAHISNLQKLVDFGTTSGGSILGPLGYKFGVAQKLLNLLLKYHWCLGHIVEPPHCPVDRIVLEKTSLRGKLNWTEIVSAEQYMHAVSAIRQVAKPLSLSLAQWELAYYQRR